MSNKVLTRPPVMSSHWILAAVLWIRWYKLVGSKEFFSCFPILFKRSRVLCTEYIIEMFSLDDKIVCSFIKECSLDRDERISLSSDSKSCLFILLVSFLYLFEVFFAIKPIFRVFRLFYEFLEFLWKNCCCLDTFDYWVIEYLLISDKI